MNNDFNLKSSILYFLGATISSTPGKKTCCTPIKPYTFEQAENIMRK